MYVQCDSTTDLLTTLHRHFGQLVGDTTDLPPQLAQLSTTGLLRHQRPEILGRWIDAAVTAGLVLVSPDQYRTLSLTDEGRSALTGKVQDVRIVAPSRAARPPAWRQLHSHRGTFRRRDRFSDEW